jgi:hypothetical protein
MIALPWTAPSFAAMKRIILEPSTKPTMKPESRDALLTAIAKARGWIDDIRLGRIASFAGIAEREAVGEQHIRLLAPLAFLSPRITSVTSIATTLSMPLCLAPSIGACLLRPGCGTRQIRAMRQPNTGWQIQSGGHDWRR